MRECAYVVALVAPVGVAIRAGSAIKSLICRIDRKEGWGGVGKADFAECVHTRRGEKEKKSLYHEKCKNEAAFVAAGAT